MIKILLAGERIGYMFRMAAVFVSMIMSIAAMAVVPCGSAA